MWASADSRRHLATNPFTECRVEMVRSAQAFRPSASQVQALLGLAEGERSLQPRDSGIVADLWQNESGNSLEGSLVPVQKQAVSAFFVKCKSGNEKDLWMT